MPLRDDLHEFYGAWEGRRALICGLGPSIELLHGCPTNDNIITFGVNDIGRYFDPDYLVVIDRPESFHGDRLGYIWNASPRLGTWIGTGFANMWKEHIMDSFYELRTVAVNPQLAMPPWHDVASQIHKASSSPYTAASLAGFMGIKDIALIGVDMVDHPRMGPEIVSQLNEVFFPMLNDFFKLRGIKMCNLSPDSAIKSVPHVSLEDWFGAPQRN